MYAKHASSRQKSDPPSPASGAAYVEGATRIVFDLATAVLTIVLFDLLLSGDNAVVIGMAARRLSPENRRRAILFGGIGAIGLRILFTATAALLLAIPLLQAIGGLLLIWIAYRLIRPEDHAANVGEAGSLAEAIRTIVLADIVMSLDNILAIGGAAHGDIRLLVFGLLLSIPIILFGSTLVARLLGRFPILVYAGAVILIYTAVQMFLEDRFVHRAYGASRVELLAIATLVAVMVIGFGLRAQRVAASATHGISTEPSPPCARSVDESAGNRPSVELRSDRM